MPTERDTVVGRELAHVATIIEPALCDYVTLEREGRRGVVCAPEGADEQVATPPDDLREVAALRVGVRLDCVKI